MSIQKVDKVTGDTTLLAGSTLWADAPLATVLPYSAPENTVPAGWLVANGQAVSRTTYSELFALIGTTYGTGDGSTTFNLPDLRESTIKGVGLTSKSNNHYDADGGALGEFVEDRVQSHTHKVYTYPTASSGTSYVQGNNGTGNGNYSAYGDASDIKDGRSGATTEVKAVCMYYIIKAKQVALPADLESAVEDAVEEMCTDTVTDGDMRPVTSNAVYDATQNLIIFSSSASTQAKFHAAMEVAVSAALPKGKSAGLVLYWSGHMQYGGFASNPTNSTLIIGWYYAISSDNSNLTTSTSIYYNYGS